MKRPWPPEDDLFFLVLAIAVFLTFVVSLMMNW